MAAAEGEEEEAWRRPRLLGRTDERTEGSLLAYYRVGSFLYALVYTRSPHSSKRKLPFEMTQPAAAPTRLAG